MILIGNGSPGRTVRGPTPDEVDFSLTTTRRDTVIVESQTSDRTTDDSVYIDHSSATIDIVFDVTATENIPGTFDQKPTFESLDTSIATVDGNGIVTRVSDGTVGILVSTTSLTKRVDVQVQRQISAPTAEFIRFLDDSLAKHCSDAVDDRLENKSASTAKLIHNGTTYNADCWALDLGVTCLTREIPRGTLVSPRHIVGAEHFQPGSSVSFLKKDGTIVSRSVTARQNVGLSNALDGYDTDVVVCLLDSDVPSDIDFAKILPTDYSDYLPGLANGVPCLCLDQEEKALVGDFFSTVNGVHFKYPQIEQRKAFFELKIHGDSGNPAFLIINDELVLVTTWTFGGNGLGPNYTDIADQINTTMTNLGGGYTLTEVDLSGFPTY